MSIARERSWHTRPVRQLAAGAVLDDGPYVLDAPVGRGGPSHVWRAHHCHTRERVIIKLLRGMATGAEPHREARALMRLNHPNIARLIEAHLDAVPPYFVTEHVAGETLARYLGELHIAGHRLTISQAARIVVQLGEACLHAHRNGVIHRDLKPQNVLVHEVNGELHTKVVDFGVARLTDTRDRSQETTIGRIFGTVYYMAPEQIKGRARTTKVDAFALAAMSFELFTGYRCFVRVGGRPMPAFVRPIPAEENGTYDTFHRIVAEPRPSPRSLRLDLPAALEEAILRGLEVEESERSDVEQLIASFRAFMTPSRRPPQTFPWPLDSDLQLNPVSLEEPSGSYTPLPSLEVVSKARGGPVPRTTPLLDAPLTTPVIDVPSSVPLTAVPPHAPPPPADEEEDLPKTARLVIEEELPKTAPLVIEEHLPKTAPMHPKGKLPKTIPVAPLRWVGRGDSSQED